MRTRTETIVTYDRAWATPEGERPEVDVVLPHTATDWMITDYDGVEALFIVEDGKIKEYDNDKRNFIPCGGEKV